MSYRSTNLSFDIARNSSEVKRIVFYQAGLKVYGMLPYILLRRLKGQFISNYWVHTDGTFSGAGVIAPTNESNYTAIPYQQSAENAQRLWHWLHDGHGFEYAIASAADFEHDIWQANVGQFPPQVWVPGEDAKHEHFVHTLGTESIGQEISLFRDLKTTEK